MDVTTFLQLLLFGVVWGGLYALIATGLNVIYGVMKILNIAHGELMMLGAYMTFWLFTLWSVSPLISLPLAAVAMFLFGIVIQKALIDPLVAHNLSMGEFENATLIVFFAVLLILQNAALLLWSADYRVVSYATSPVHIGPLSVAANRLIVVLVALLVSALMYVGLQAILPVRSMSSRPRSDCCSPSRRSRSWWWEGWEVRVALCLPGCCWGSWNRLRVIFWGRNTRT